MARKRNKQSKILLVPTDEEIRAERKKLPIFKAHDLRLLLREARANKNVGVDIGVLAAFRRHNEIQMKKLLGHLGIDPSQPDAASRGFFLLAHYHHGLGCLAWYRRRTNRNAATWTSTNDFALLREVVMLTKEGLSERAAIKRPAADRKKRPLFPYRRQAQRHFPKQTEQQQREAALWARLRKLIASARGTSLVSLIVGVRDDGLGFYERTLRDLDTSNSLPLELVKNQRPSN